METFADIVLYALGAVGGATVLWKLFENLMSRWVDDKLKRGFQGLLHDQTREIELLRADLTKAFDRASKLHHREFEVLPAVWEKVCDAFWTANSLVHPFQEYPDLNAMSSQQLDDFLDNSPLRDWERIQVRVSNDMNAEYVDLIYWHRNSKSMSALREASGALARSGIFIEDDVRGQLSEIVDHVHTALVESQINTTCPPLSPADRLKDGERWMREVGPRVLEKAETAIKDRLWDRKPS